MDAMKEKLREFYEKQYEASLSIRKTATNYLLIEKLNGKKTILARFSIVGLGDQAESMAATARHCLCYKRAMAEMEKLGATVATKVIVTAEDLGVDIKAWPIQKQTPADPLFDRIATAAGQSERK